MINSGKTTTLLTELDIIKTTIENQSKKNRILRMQAQRWILVRNELLKTFKNVIVKQIDNRIGEAKVEEHMK